MQREVVEVPAADLPSLPQIQVQWTGWPLDQVPTAESLLESNPWVHGLTPEELDRYRKFYAGEQWDPAVRARRMVLRRPTLVVNWLPAIVALIVARSSVEGRSIHTDSVSALELIVTRWNMDAQKAYNYMASAAVEMACAAASPMVAAHA